MLWSTLGTACAVSDVEPSTRALIEVGVPVRVGSSGGGQNHATVARAPDGTVLVAYEVQQWAQASLLDADLAWLDRFQLVEGPAHHPQVVRDGGDWLVGLTLADRLQVLTVGLGATP